MVVTWLISRKNTVKNKNGCLSESNGNVARFERKTYYRNLPGISNQPEPHKSYDQFLADLDQVFIEKEKITENLTRENKQLREIIGDLMVEL
jgi:hypothetical protein